MATQQKKGRIRENPALVVWWSWGDLNPRPQAIVAQFYMFSDLIWISPPASRSRTLHRPPAPLNLAAAQGARTAASQCN